MPGARSAQLPSRAGEPRGLEVRGARNQHSQKPETPYIRLFEFNRETVCETIRSKGKCVIDVRCRLPKQESGCEGREGRANGLTTKKRRLLLHCAQGQTFKFSSNRFGRRAKDGTRRPTRATAPSFPPLLESLLTYLQPRSLSRGVQIWVRV